jgi:hypothetical protein
MATTAPVNNPAYIGYSNYQNEGISALTSSLATTNSILTAQVAKEALDVQNLYANDQTNKNFVIALINDESSMARSSEAIIRANVATNTANIASNTSSISSLTTGLSAQVAKELQDVVALGQVDLQIETAVNNIVNRDNGLASQIYEKASMNNLYALSSAMNGFISYFLGTYSIVRQSDGHSMTAYELFNPVFTPNSPALPVPVPFMA